MKSKSIARWFVNNNKKKRNCWQPTPRIRHWTIGDWIMKLGTYAYRRVIARTVYDSPIKNSLILTCGESLCRIAESDSTVLLWYWGAHYTYTYIYIWRVAFFSSFIFRGAQISFHSMNQLFAYNGAIKAAREFSLYVSSRHVIYNADPTLPVRNPLNRITFHTFRR